LQTQYPDAYPRRTGYEIKVEPVHEELAQEIRPVLIVLAAAVGLLLLLACANVTGIMVSKILARTHELKVRSMLGAGRNRIIRGMITEGAILAACGGVIGLLLAFLSVGLLVNFTSRFTSLASQLSFSPGAIIFGILLSLVCGIVVGVVPSVGSATYRPLVSIATIPSHQVKPA
jgi:putative ABC transport system permease protein